MSFNENAIKKFLNNQRLRLLYHCENRVYDFNKVNTCDIHIIRI